MRRLHASSPLVTLLAMAGMAFGQTQDANEGAPAAEAPAAADSVASPSPDAGESAPPSEDGANPDDSDQDEPPFDPIEEMTNDAAIAASPDDGGPLIVGESRETWSGFKLLRWDGGLTYRYQQTDEELEQTGQPTQTDNETRHRYMLDLNGEAIIGHRNLFDLTGSVQLGLEQIEIDSSGQSFTDSEDDFLALFDLNALILGTSKAPVDVWARREQENLDRAFAGSIDQTITEYGIGTRWMTEAASTTFRLYQREQSLKGGFDSIDSTITQQTFSAQSNIRLTPTSKLDLSYVFDRITEDQLNYQDEFDRHDFSLVHTQGFGGEAVPHELRSSLRFYDQSGKQEQTRMRWDELLTLRHTEDFETRYQTLVEQFDVGDQSQLQLRGQAQAIHHLFESLTTTVTVGGQHLGLDDFTSDELFTSLRFDYTKKVPLGQLEAAVGGAFNSQTNSDRGSTLSIVNETHRLVDGFPTIVARRNVIASTVRVTAIGGFPTYIEGIDYSLVVFTDRFELRSLIGGAIVNGQSVWVSYDVGPDPGNDIDTTSLNVSLRYSITQGALDGLAFYTRYNKVTQELRSGDPNLITLEDLDDLLLGIEYERGGFTGRYEYNDHDSTFDPYSLHRVQLLYSRRIGLASRIVAEASREMIDFRRQNEEVVFDRASITSTWRLSQSTELLAALQYRNEDSSDDGVTQGFDQKLGVNWQYGRTSVSGAFKNSFVDSERSTNTAQFIEIEVTRRF